MQCISQWLLQNIFSLNKPLLVTSICNLLLLFSGQLLEKIGLLFISISGQLSQVEQARSCVIFKKLLKSSLFVGEHLWVGSTTPSHQWQGLGQDPALLPGGQHLCGHWWLGVVLPTHKCSPTNKLDLRSFFKYDT